MLAGSSEAVPARRALLAVGPLRHDKVVGEQHPVESSRGSDKLPAILGKDNPVDQGIDAGILDAARLREPGWSAAAEPQ
jgi:hypothetical protein